MAAILSALISVHLGAEVAGRGRKRDPSSDPFQDSGAHSSRRDRRKCATLSLNASFLFAFRRRLT